MELVFDYMEDPALRGKLNGLTRKTFGFDFERWVTGGFYGGDYIPYSLLEEDGMVSNVSVNRMRFLQNGVEKNYIQLGTVMTDEAFRRRGLAKRLMEYVCGLWETRCDGIYLFGDLRALEFYRKLGFSEGLQYRCTLRDGFGERAEDLRCFRPVTEPELGRRYRDTVSRAAVCSALEQLNKYSLQMFYTGNLDNVYYAGDLDCFAVLETSGGVVTLQSVIGTGRVLLRDVVARIGLPYDTLRLGFTPLPEDAPLFTAEPYDGGEDYRLFYRGEELKAVESDRLFFPALSHA